MYKKSAINRVFDDKTSWEEINFFGMKFLPYIFISSEILRTICSSAMGT